MASPSAMNATERTILEHGAYPPIEDYALLGDGRILALVSGRGSIDWLCLPRFSSASIFARLLDPQGGQFFIRPQIEFESKREYLERTTVLQTSFQTKDGVARVIDCVPIVDGLHELHPMREILRIIEGISGEVEFEIFIDPRPDFARVRPRVKQSVHLGWRFDWSNEIMAVRTDATLNRVGDSLRGSLRIRTGERRYFSLCYSKGDIGVFSRLGNSADQRLKLTLQWWQGWSKKCTYAGPYSDAVLRSALTLKLLNYALSGAMIAAPTTSLPEVIGGGRNWDYRYCWLRDAGLTMQAFIGLGKSCMTNTG
jgi:GH15 family glucan-1,4-alpha-glucosidase